MQQPPETVMRPAARFQDRYTAPGSWEARRCVRGSDGGLIRMRTVSEPHAELVSGEDVRGDVHRQRRGTECPASEILERPNVRETLKNATRVNARQRTTGASPPTFGFHRRATTRAVLSTFRIHRQLPELLLEARKVLFCQAHRWTLVESFVFTIGRPACRAAPRNIPGICRRGRVRRWNGARTHTSSAR